MASEVIDFGKAMNDKLRKMYPIKGNSWKNMSIMELENLLKTEWDEHDTNKKDGSELVDIANFCMMIWSKLNSKTLRELKTEYDYIVFIELDCPERKTRVFECRTKSDDFYLGSIYWDTGWRRYILDPTAESHRLSEGCLLDIAHFIRQIMDERLGKVYAIAA